MFSCPMLSPAPCSTRRDRFWISCLSCWMVSLARPNEQGGGRDGVAAGWVQDWHRDLNHTGGPSRICGASGASGMGFAGVVGSWGWIAWEGKGSGVVGWEVVRAGGVEWDTSGVGYGRDGRDGRGCGALRRGAVHAIPSLSWAASTIFHALSISYDGIGWGRR